MRMCTVMVHAVLGGKIQANRFEAVDHVSALVAVDPKSPNQEHTQAMLSLA